MSGYKPTGRHREKVLTAAAVRNLGPGFHADGGNLYLKVDPSGARRWILRLNVQRKRKDIGLGPVSLVSLAEAREAALQHRKIARAGDDPLAAKRRSQTIPTFEEAARQVHEQREGDWDNDKHTKQWLSTLEKYAFPKIGTKQIIKIDSHDVLLVLDPIWTTKLETARRVKQRIGTVLKWGVARGFRTDNPADFVQQALSKPDKSKSRKMKAVKFGEVQNSIARVNESNASAATKLAFEFLVHSACRSGEVRGALWSEIDIGRAVWTIPAKRMKKRRQHRVPLTAHALSLLEKAESLRRDDTDLIFPSPTGKTLSDMTLSKLIRELGIPAVPHGFRTSFKEWASEATNHPNQVSEFALAHVVSDKTEAAYHRSDLFEKRRVLMKDWSDYITTPPKNKVYTRA